MKRSAKVKKTNLKQVAFTRFMLVVAVFVLWIGGISVRLVHLQVTQHAWLNEKALENRQQVDRTRTLRGSILDRNDRTLAMSVRAKTLYANPMEIEDVDAAAGQLAKALKMNEKELGNQLRAAREAKKQYLPIAKKLDDDTAQKLNKALDTAGVKKADLPNTTGLHWTDDQKRSYPYQSLASQVVGFSNAEDDGRAGIEQSEDEVLHGAAIKKLQERDRLGRVYESETITEREPPSDVVLTLNAAYQYMVEQALEKGVRAADAKSGIAIVMLPKTGDIIALANYPTFDPNLISEKTAENIGNKAIQGVYSPGSVFKIVTYGSALEKKLFSPEDQIDAGDGTIQVANHKFSDPHRGRFTYSEALAHSSNVCAIKTGLRVGRDDFYAMVQKMGFGSKTGIELPAETQGIVRNPEKWNGDSLASMSIGYEIGVTALQITSAFATIANDGIRVQPHIIKEIRRSDGQPKSVTQVEQRQVVTAATAKNLRTMLRQVVLSGTGTRAQLSGYSVAGKTGTAWKVNGKSKSVDSSKYVSSFIGMAPADNPEIVVAVVMDEPKVGARDGGMVSAPVFKEIAQQILQDMKVPMDIPVKQEGIVAKDVPEVPASKTADKPKSEIEPKVAQKSAPKEKSKDPKKTNDKKFSGPGKLTALCPRRYSIGQANHVET